MTVVFWSTPEPMWLYLTPQHDGFLCNAIWGVKGQAHSPELSCLDRHVLWFLWTPWIFFTLLYMVVGEWPKFFAILHCVMWFLICLTLLSWNSAQSDEPWSSFAKTEMLLLYPNMIPWPITNSPAYCELFQKSLTWIFYNLFTFILPLSQLFSSVLQPSKSKFVHIYKIHLRWSVKTLEIFSLYFCQS